MTMPQSYYQLGGFQSPLHWYHNDEKRLAQAIAGDHSSLRPNTNNVHVELALGIKTSGTSHLLLTVDRARHVAHRLRLPYPQARPLPSVDFESISPIYFQNADELAKKLGTMKPKHQKGRVPVDNSQANKQFTLGEAGVQRGTFEHGRLVYHILQNTLDLHTYGLGDASWAQSLQVCSFVLNTPLVDERPIHERLTAPKVLDVGIADATIPGLTCNTAIHIRGTWNGYLSKGKQGRFEYGTTENLDRDAANLRVQDFFKGKTIPDSRPTVLLVHEKDTTINFLKNCGVDTTKWESGIKGLLGFETYKKIKPEPGPSRPNDPRLRQQPTPGPDPRSASGSTPYDDYDQRRHRPRSRSHSPRRRSSGSSYQASRRSPPRSSGSLRSRPTSRSYAPLYVVDVQELYIKLMQTQVGADGVNAISKQFGLGQLDWCAGNEAVRIVDIWRSMISGPSIDEQRTARTAPDQSSAPQLQPVAQVQQTPDGADSDEERDPNDFAPIPATVPLEMNAAYGDDDSDYGQSDSD